jgi:hypothetical protein
MVANQGERGGRGDTEYPHRDPGREEAVEQVAGADPAGDAEHAVDGQHQGQAFRLEAEVRQQRRGVDADALQATGHQKHDADHQPEGPRAHGLGHRHAGQAFAPLIPRGACAAGLARRHADGEDGDRQADADRQKRQAPIAAAPAEMLD